MTQYNPRGAAGKASPQTVKATRVPAPIKGVDTRVATSEGDPQNCVFAFNMVPSEQDVRVRKGYREHVIDVNTPQSPRDGIHTIIPFHSSDPVKNPDKLFCATNEGIWDVTEYNTTPTLSITFDSPSVVRGSGYGNFVHYVNDAERDVLIYADELNGLFMYDADTNTWAVATDLTAPLPATVRFVTMHKDRLWFCVKDSSTVYYLAAGAVGGAATPFHMGGKMPHGGSVAGIFDWSVDSGNGLDAMLVIVSTSGDIIVYAGDNPESAETWRVVGSYYIGQVPKGSTFGSEHGGNLYILSAYGLVSMNGLLQGVNAEGALTTADNASTTNKITAIIRATMLKTISSFGWEIRVAPTEGALIVNPPHQGSNLSISARIQYVFSLTMEAWGFWRDLPMGAFNTWNDRVVFGTHDNRIVFMDVRVDNELITPVGEVNGDSITFSLLTSFQSYGELAQYKHVVLIRPDFIGVRMPTFRASATYDYRVDEQVSKISGAPPVDEAYWDVSLWDAARWTRGLPDGKNRVSGSFGYGRYVAISVYGETRERLALVGFDVMYKSGSPLI